MANEQMFKTAFSGFNKQEVTDYIEELNNHNKKEIDEYSNRISELKNIVEEQRTAIKEKNNEIEELLDKVEEAQNRAGDNMNQMSLLVDELSDKEKKFKEIIAEKEAAYESEINKLKSDLNKKESEFKQAKEDAQNSKDTEIKNIKDAYTKEIKDLKTEYEDKLSGLELQNTRKLEEQKQAYTGELEMLREAHAKELAEMEDGSKKAIDKAKCELAEIKASLDSARALEEEARIRSEKLLAETRMQCNEIKRRNEKEISQFRAESISLVDEEVNLRRNEVREACKKMHEIISAVDNTREKFINECDRIKQSLQGLM